MVILSLKHVVDIRQILRKVLPTSFCNVKMSISENVASLKFTPEPTLGDLFALGQNFDKYVKAQGWLGHWEWGKHKQSETLAWSRETIRSMAYNKINRGTFHIVIEGLK